MATEAEILTKLNDLLDDISATLDAAGASKLVKLDRNTGADSALMYLRQNGDERFRVGLVGGSGDFVIQHSPDGSPLSYADVLRIDSDTGDFTMSGGLTAEGQVGALIASNGGGTAQASILLRRDGAIADRRQFEILYSGLDVFTLRSVNAAYSASYNFLTAIHGESGVAISDVALKAQGTARLEILGVNRLAATTSGVSIVGAITASGGATEHFSTRLVAGRGDAHVGSEGVGGILHLHGDPTGAEGGELRFYMADAHDDSIDFIALDAFQDDLRCFRPGLGEIFRVQGDTGAFRHAQSVSDQPGVGNTITGASLYGGAFFGSRDSVAALWCNRNGSDGPVAVWHKAGVAVGAVSITGTGTTYQTSSGRHLKTHIETFEGDAGRMIDELQPRSFNWRATGERRHGFIADEFANVFPASVQYDELGRAAAIDASTPEVIATLVSELQSLRMRVASLEHAS